MIQVFRPKYEVEECLAELRKVLESGWTGTGPQCAAFEKSWCEYTGAGDALFLNSATAGLHLALETLPSGYSVLTTPITFVSTNAAILYAKQHPVFLDINPDTMAIDLACLKSALQKRHSLGDAHAVTWVHYAGNVSPEFDEAVKLCQDHGVTVVEDCAHAAGAFYPGGWQRVGSRPDTISVFSFQAVKNLPTMDAGLISVGEMADKDLVRRLSWLGIDKSTYARTGDTAGSELYKWRYTVDRLGWKYNGNDVAAAIANVQLRYLDRDNAYRRQIYQWYKSAFAGQTRVRLHQHGPGSSVHLNAVRVDAAKRDLVMAQMRFKGFAPGMHYLPNHEFPAFASWPTPPLPETQRAAQELVTLPTHLLLTKKDVDAIAEVVLEASK